jgi:hypothetical protein
MHFRQDCKLHIETYKDGSVRWAECACGEFWERSHSLLVENIEVERQRLTQLYNEHWLSKRGPRTDDAV